MINRRHKDTVFRDLFGAPERKANALDLYNALNKTSYRDESLLEVTTLDDVIYMGVKNDVSFLIDDEMVLWEHQSTRNPNMPLRGLLYFARLYSAYVERNDLNVYGTRLIRLPTPRYMVFYAGEDDQPDRVTLRLSDAFADGHGDMEVTATVVNVNAGHSPEILDECETLWGYARLLQTIREQDKANGLDAAVDAAIQQCIDEGVLVDYLTAKRAEVVDMFMTEYDEAKAMRLFREEGRREGRQEGRREERNSFLARASNMVRNGTLTLQDAATTFGFSERELSERL